VGPVCPLLNEEEYELSPMIGIIGRIKEYISGLDKDRWIKTTHVK